MAAFHLLGFAGSLRQGSFNRFILRAAAELFPMALSWRSSMKTRELIKLLFIMRRRKRPSPQEKHTLR